MFNLIVNTNNYIAVTTIKYNQSIIVALPQMLN